MDPLLIDRWMEGLCPLPVLDEASIAAGREQVRRLAGEQGLSTEDAGKLATVVSELGTNQLRHGLEGVIGLRAAPRDGAGGVEIVAADRGRGIADPTRALRGEVRPRGSLGTGLGSVLRLCDEVDFDVRLGQGMAVFARKLCRPGRRRREVAILGRPVDGERLSGDDATFVRLPDALVLILADGLGHGEPALEASSRAVAVLRAQPGRPPSDILRECDAALHGTRGGVAAVVHLDEASGELAHASVGNVDTRVLGPGKSKGFGGHSFVLGGRGGAKQKPRQERAVVDARDVVVMFSDGLSARMRLDEPGLLRSHPLLIAHRLMEDHARSHDDVTVLVAR